MRIRIPIAVIVVLALVACFAVYVTRSSKKYDKTLKLMEQVENRKVLSGVITEVSKVSLPSQYYVHYSYRCNGQNYQSKLRLAQVKDTSVLCVLPSKKILVIVSANNCNFSYPILTKTDVAKFNIGATDNTTTLVDL